MSQRLMQYEERHLLLQFLVFLFGTVETVFSVFQIIASPRCAGQRLGTLSGSKRLRPYSAFALRSLKPSSVFRFGTEGVAVNGPLVGVKAWEFHVECLRTSSRTLANSSFSLMTFSDASDQRFTTLVQNISSMRTVYRCWERTSSITTAGCAPSTDLSFSDMMVTACCWHPPHLHHKHFK